MTNERKITILVLILAIGFIIFDVFFEHSDDAKIASQKIVSVEHRIDTLKVKYSVHDTVEKVLRTKALALVLHDTIHDTLRIQAIDTLTKALDECDSSKGLRDSVIAKIDTVVQIAQTETKPKPDYKGYGVAAFVGALIAGTGALLLILR